MIYTAVTGSATENPPPNNKIKKSHVACTTNRSFNSVRSSVPTHSPSTSLPKRYLPCSLRRWGFKEEKEGVLKCRKRQRKTTPCCRTMTKERDGVAWISVCNSVTEPAKKKLCWAKLDQGDPALQTTKKSFGFRVYSGARFQGWNVTLM